MATNKTLLKAVKSAIDARDFALARERASDLVVQDAKNYTALIFLGFAYQNLDNFEEAEKAYQRAIDLKPSDSQAFKGLIALYEKQDGKVLDKYHAIVLQLGELLPSADSPDQLRSLVEKYIIFARKHGTKAQYRHALELHLPSCSFYAGLEGTIPHPSHTLARIIESMESEEREWINTQIGERRTRLGAKVDQVTLDVKREAFARYPLSTFYQQLIDWTLDDDVRRSSEEQLLRREYDLLLVLSEAEKPSQNHRVLNLANGMVTVKHQFLLAWTLALDWVDAENLSDWDPNILQDFIEFFPDSGLSKVLQGYFASTTNTTKPGEQPVDQVENLPIMEEGLQDSEESLLAHRVMTETHLSQKDYQAAVDVARKSQKLHLQAAQRGGVQLSDSIDSVNMTLASALVFFQSPRYHQEAKQLFEEILARKPTSTTALSGVGEILKEDGEFDAAVSFFRNALEKDPDNLKLKTELAWCHALSKESELAAGLAELVEVVAMIKEKRPEDLELRALALYRIGFCQWMLNDSKYPRGKKTGPYKYFIESATLNPNYAPTYTALGIFFQDYGKSLARARTAFQKAFELSSAEVEAARRLASIFADNKEWDLVELVAARIVESGVATPAPGSKRKALSWPFAALGVVDMNKQQFSTSIVHFQKALRIAPDDYNSWVSLGESYHNSGRYLAAERALRQAASLDNDMNEDQKWFASYMLANVQQELGAYDAAISGYENVLRLRPDDFGVGLALLQTRVDNARYNYEAGRFGEAALQADEALQTANRLSKTRTRSFNLWKGVADACALLSSCPSHGKTDEDSLKDLLGEDESEEMQKLIAVDGINQTDSHNSDQNPKTRRSWSLLLKALHASRKAIIAASSDSHAKAVSWYNLGWIQYRISNFKPSPDGALTKKALVAAIKSFKNAIEFEAGNSDFWNAFGVATIKIHPKLSQHALVRSLHLNDRSARTWANLGAFYLIHNENELANQAFTRAQSADPDFAQAWLGQGLLATLVGDAQEALGLFTHAFGISSASSTIIKQRYAVASFDRYVDRPEASTEALHLVQPLLALHQLKSQKPDDLNMIHLLALFGERIGNFGEAAETLTKVCESVEQDYEKTESVEALSRYSQAKADLARSQLSESQFQAALDNAEMALDLSSEDSAAGMDRAARHKWRLSAHLTAAVSAYFLSNYDRAISFFQEALEETDHDPDVVSMLARVLWAKGGTEDRSTAREFLYDSIEKHPQHVGATTLLGVIALIDKDADAIAAVEDDLKSLRLSNKLLTHEKDQVAQVLHGVSAFRIAQEPEKSNAALFEAQREIMMAPAEARGWSELAQVSGDSQAAEMALSNAKRKIPPRGETSAEELSAAYADTGRRRDALQAIMVAPWGEKGWNALADCL